MANPELKYLPSRPAVTNRRLASNRGCTSNGERRDAALFVDVEVYGKPGEALAQHKAKGDSLGILTAARSATPSSFGHRKAKSGTLPETPMQPKCIPAHSPAPITDRTLGGRDTKYAISAILRGAVRLHRFWVPVRTVSHADV